MTIPRQRPDQSKQDYGTPKPFLRAARHKLGTDDFAIDLAAHSRNAVVPVYLDSDVDALSFPDWAEFIEPDAWG